MGRAATQCPSETLAHSASANKTHRGEGTEQEAVERGLDEWSGHWGAREQDSGDVILDLVLSFARDGPDAWYLPEDGRLDPNPLPRINEERVDKTARTCRGDTGIGMDALRLRHVAWLSRGAKAGLAIVLMLVEAIMRWPAAARGTLAVALAKKGGGSRLIGLITSVYR